MIVKRSWLFFEVWLSRIGETAAFLLFDSIILHFGGDRALTFFEIGLTGSPQ